MTADIRGHRMDLNNPCFFLKGIGQGCADYDNRPTDPCKIFRCGWLQDDDDTIPEWMQPNISNVIILMRWVDDKKVLKLRQCGEPVNGKTIAWFFDWAQDRADLIEISLFDDVYYYGEELRTAVRENRYRG